MASLSLNGITKTFGSVTAVDNLDLAIDDGELLVLVGPSGCGKTTVLRLIAGLETPDRGTVRIGEGDATKLAPRERDVAMVFQNNALYPHMTVRDNMAFGLKQRGLTQEIIKERIHEASQLLNIDELLTRLPGELSGGQQQRVAFGRAIVRRPAVYLFDEPLSNLDADLRTKMRTELKRLHRTLGRTMVYVTHDQTEALTLADRIAVMSDGSIQQTAQPLELYQQPGNQFVASFIGNPPMNFFEGELREVNKHVEFTTSDLRIPLGNRSPCRNIEMETLPCSVVLGIRPEHVTIDGEKSTMSAKIKIVEFAGESAFIHLAIGSTTFVARQRSNLPNSSRNANGHGAEKLVNVSFDATQMHFFDSRTGKRHEN